MNKAVLISIQPKWCARIENGEKTIEVRKTCPTIQTPFKCYIYCTKGKKELLDVLKDGDIDYFGEVYHGKTSIASYRPPLFLTNSVEDYKGKVIGEFVCDKCIKIISEDYDESGYYGFLTKTCLSIKELFNYGKGETLYGLHISDVKIYDKPKELGEFKTPPCDKPDTACRNCKWRVETNTPEGYESECYVEYGHPLTCPPQSWFYVQELEN